MFSDMVFLFFLTECAIIGNNAVSVVIGLGSMAIQTECSARRQSIFHRSDGGDHEKEHRMGEE